jgi:membrane-bound acyltransferase YfiQ involved in biofilm formation
MVHFKMLMTIFALCFSIFALHFFNILSFGFPLYDTIAELYAYSFILLMFLLFKKYVNAQNRTAKYLSRNSFGIYFFHQTWIVVFGYFTLTYIQSIPLQIALILVLSIIFTFLTVEICKRNKVLRILFGIRNV